MNKEAISLVNQMQESVKNAVPWSTTFLFLEPGCGAVGQETPLAAAIEMAMKKKFQMWAETWIAPQLKRLADLVDSSPDSAVIAEATELLRNAQFSDGQGIILTQDAEALEAAIKRTAAANDQQPPEAGLITSESEPTPQQLREQCDVLMAALKRMVSATSMGFEDRDADEEGEAWDEATAALAAATGLTGSPKVPAYVFNNHDAVTEGWWLSSRDDGILEIQRIDDPGSYEDIHPQRTDPFFDSDEQARDFVKKRAQMGSSYHMVALHLDGLLTDFASVRSKLTAERDAYVLGVPDGTEQPNPQGWAEDCPVKSALLRRMNQLRPFGRIELCVTKDDPDAGARPAAHSPRGMGL